MSQSVLVVEDDRFLQENLLSLLRAEGYSVSGVAFGEAALKSLEANPADLVVLDLGLPDMDGITACRRIRGRWHIPILMLTARTDPADKVMGLEMGADDYLTKPFDAKEFIARVRAHLRRSKQYATANDESEVAEHVFNLGSLKVDFNRREVSVDDRVIVLTSKEFDVIAYLAQNCDRAISRDQLFQTVWGFDLDFSTNSLDVHVYRLRKKIEKNPDTPQFIHTLRGYGYKLSLDA